MEKNELPSIIIKDGVLSISITEDDLQHIAESNSESNYKIVDKRKFIEDFAETLANYQGSNAKEKGMTEIQILFDLMIDETYVDGSEAIVDLENPPS